MSIELIRYQRDKNSGELYATPPNGKCLIDSNLKNLSLSTFCRLAERFRTFQIIFLSHEIQPNLKPINVKFIRMFQKSYSKFSLNSPKFYPESQIIIVLKISIKLTLSMSKFYVCLISRN